jgi:hypothetical protein
MSAAETGRRGVLLESTAADLLVKNGIDYVEHRFAEDVGAAAAAATEIGYPVVLKVVSPDATHKTDVGGVVLDIRDQRSLVSACASASTSLQEHAPGAGIAGWLVSRYLKEGQEMIVGAVRDETFGPAVMVGAGGIYAEAMADVSFRLAPLTHRDAREMIDELRCRSILDGLRGGQRADVFGLADVIVRVGGLLDADETIVEIDLNPVNVSAYGCVALDARIVIGV